VSRESEARPLAATPQLDSGALGRPISSFVRSVLGLLLLVACQSRAKCPDMTGRYVVQGEDGRAYLSVRQNACASALIGWSTRSDVHADSSSQLFIFGDGLRPARPWTFGTTPSLATAGFVRDTLKIRGAGAMPDDTALLWSFGLFQLDSINMCVLSGNKHGRYGTIVVRIDSGGEDAAAARSESPVGELTKSCS
jgi:hypothetical protein